MAPKRPKRRTQDQDSKSENNAVSSRNEPIASQTAATLQNITSDKTPTDPKFARAASTDGELNSTRQRSASRSSSTNDDPKSLIDSISAASMRQNWSTKEMAEDEPSMSSIKGDSVSATIADYNRKHRTKSGSGDRAQVKMATNLGSESLARNDDSSVNINFYAAGGSTSGIVNTSLSSKPGDFASVSTNTNVDAFDVIEESNRISSSEDITPKVPRKRKGHRKHHHRRHHHHNQQHRRPSSSLEQALDIVDLQPEPVVYQIEPIIIRGNGNLTLFGLSNSFNPEFPSALIGRVSKEEFELTMRRINSLLRDQQSLSAKLLVLGGLFCCCSFGFSLLWPSIALKKRSKASLEKLLAGENSRLYTKLGLNWKLAEQRCYSNHAFIEYVLMIEFTPKINIYLPD